LDIFQFLYDSAKRGCAKLFDMAREDEGDGILIRKFEQIVLELLDIGLT
jgi:hypothetical protein